MKYTAALLVAGLGLTVLGLVPGTVSADLFQELQSGFQYRVETLAHHTFIELEPDGINVGNFLGFARHESAMNVRPDFNLEIRRLGLDFRPRYDLSYRRFESGPLANTTDTADDLYIQEWEARLSLSDAFLVSTGRVNLQWGPSYILSPSNPFNRSNGRNDPQVEEPGLEVSQLIWFPNYRWTVTLLANTGKGRLASEQPFSPRYALRTDFIGDGWFAGVVGSITEDEQDPVIGGFAGWTVSEAVLLHTEWNVDSGPTNGNALKDGDYLVGGSYTFTSGAFLVAEFFRGGTGCTE
ncbi:MAG: hypothetical protein HKN21_10295, partial [Candidatus Eisenbacteria bacterium]|nr:hypothetical protein [Candidatus Eisenbacteria bacterium]